MVSFFSLLTSMVYDHIEITIKQNGTGPQNVATGLADHSLAAILFFVFLPGDQAPQLWQRKRTINARLFYVATPVKKAW